MYLGYYGLHEPPFSITPDPRFVHLSERHRDALAHLLFGIDKGGSGGFVQLTGEVGTGKTTVSRLLLERLPADTRIALVLNPRQNAIELLESICEELHIDIAGGKFDRSSGSTKALVDALNAYLLDAYAQGLRVVLLIDEAQNLPADALEQVRLLTNLETDTQKLLQILLLGQPELRVMLARPELRQLAQRITARYHLTPLDARETADYLRHRWRVAGGERFPFDAKAVQRIHARAGGVPRLLNVIAERALLAGYARDAVGIDAKLIDLAADEVLPPIVKRAWWLWLAAAAVVAMIGVTATQWRTQTQLPTPVARAVAKPGAAPPVQPPRVAAIETLDASGLARRIGTIGDTPVPAWQQLLALWALPAGSITVDPVGPCTRLQADVHCVHGRATLATLLALDRPVLLRLQDGNAAAWVLLLGADARSARLRLGGETIEIDRVLLQARWDGTYAGLWRGPAALSSTPRMGASGPAVDWLRRQLSPSTSATAGAPFDAALRADVQALQSARGLPADGIAGPLTMMSLAGGLPGPRLVRVLQ